MSILDKLRRMRNLAILRTLPPCKDVVQIVSASLDRKLTLRETFIMRLHLVACKPCVRYFQQSEFLQTAAHELDEKLTEDFFSGKLSEEAKKRMKDLLKTSLGLFALFCFFS